MGSVRYLNFILTIVAIMLGLQLATTWSDRAPEATAAYGQGIPDSGAQRQQIIDQLKLVNTRTSEIKSLLASGKLQVVVALPEAPPEQE